MKKILLSFIALLMLFASGVNAQVVTIGSESDNKTTDYVIAAGGLYSYTQTIYFQSDINTSGYITKVAYYWDGTSTLASTPIDLYLGTTTSTEYFSNWMRVATMEQVYSGSIEASAAGWVEITLDTPYYYDNTENLVVGVDENGSSYNSSPIPFVGEIGNGWTGYKVSSTDLVPPTPELNMKSERLYSANSGAAIKITFTQTLETMSFDSVYVAANVGDNIRKGAEDEVMMLVGVHTTGSTSPISLTELKVTESGTTISLADIDNIKVYYTALDSTFSTDNLVGSVVPSGATTDEDIITTDVALSEGANYFWVAIDLNENATSNQYVKMQATSATVGGTTYAMNPTMKDNVTRMVDNSFVMPSGTGNEVTTCNMTFMDDGGAGSYSPSFNGTLTLYPGNSCDKLKMAFTSFSLRYSSSDYHDYMIIYDGNSTSAPEIGTYKQTDLDGVTITSTAADGALTVKFYSEYYVGTMPSGWSANVTCIEGGTMTVDDAALVQNNTNDVSIFETENVEIAALQVNVSNNSCAIDLTDITVNTGASLDNVDSVYIYYTGLDANYATTTLFGKANAVAGDMVVSGTQELQEGTNYFWIAYDLVDNANPGTLDVTCTQITADGNHPTITATNPTGSRNLVLGLVDGTNSYTTTCSGTVYDEGGATGQYVKNTNGTLTLYPNAVNYGVQLDFTALSLSNDALNIYNGEAASGTPLAELTGTTLPAGTIESTHASGALTLELISDGDDIIGDGWEATIGCYDMSVGDDMAVTGTTVTQSSTADIAAASTNNELIRLEVTAENTANPLSLTSMTLNFDASTALADIANIDIYYTGTNDALDTSAAKFWSGAPQAGDFNATGSTELAAGVNYFWVVVDIAESATPGNTVDALCSATNFATPTESNPAGTRSIVLTMLNGKDIVINTCQGTLYDDGGSTGNYSDNFNGTLTIYPDADNKLVVLDMVYHSGQKIAEGYDSLLIYNSDQSFTGEDYYRYGGPNDSWSASGTFKSIEADGRIKLLFASDATTNAYGWEMQISCVDKPDPVENMVYTSSQLTQPTTADVEQGESFADLAVLEVVTTKSGNPLNLTAMDISLDGTTSLSDLSNLRVYYSTSNTSYSVSDIISYTSAITNTISFNDSKVLAEGANYFWVVAAVDGAATHGNFADATVTGFTLTDGAHTPTANDAGNRQIIDPNYVEPVPMQFVSCDVTQASTDIIDASFDSRDKEIIRIEVVTDGPDQALIMDSIIYNMTGTTILFDIINVDIFYTGNSDVFSNANNVYGGYPAGINDENTVLVNQELVEGSNYFWLAVDLSTEPTANNYVDAQCTGIYVDGILRTPSNTNPSGDRMIYLPSNDMTVISTTVYDASTATVAPNDMDKEIIRIEVVTEGVDNALQLEDMTITMNGTGLIADVSGITVYQTSTASFATTNEIATATPQAGDIVVTPAASITLVEGTSYFWVAYDIAANATHENYVDATCSAMTISSSLKTPANQASGNRQIWDNTPPMEYVSSTVTQNNTDDASIGAADQEILGFQVVTEGVDPVLSLTEAIVNMNGSEADVSTVKIYATGASNVFATGTQVGTAAAAAGDVTISISNAELAEGTNYFWLTYDIAANATENNTVDAQIVSLNVGSVVTPSNANPTGSRTIIDSTKVDMAYVSSTVTQNNTNDVNAGATDQEILGLQVVTQGEINPVSLTSITFTMASTTSNADVDAVKVYQTSTASFATTKLVGSGTTVSSSLSIANAELANGTNYFWLAFDIDANATNGNKVDAAITAVNVGGTKTPTVQDPAGSRTIVADVPEEDMAYVSATVTQNNTSAIDFSDDFVSDEYENIEIIGVEIVTENSNNPLSLTELVVSMTGTTDINDIDGIEVYYTGTTATFGTDAFFGDATPATGSISVSGTQQLAEGTNYFWVVYDLNIMATSDNYVDAECTSVTVGGSAKTPSTTAPEGKRQIDPTVGIADVQFAGVKVSPNPSNGIFMIENIESNTQITIVNITGEVVMQTQANDEQVQIDLSNQPKGFYMVRMTINGAQHTERLIVQ